MIIPDMAIFFAKSSVLNQVVVFGNAGFDWVVHGRGFGPKKD